MQEKEREKKDQRKRDLEELIAKREAALVFAKNEEEKMRRRRKEAEALSKVHIEQAVSTNPKLTAFKITLQFDCWNTLLQDERQRKERDMREQDLAYARKDLEICEAEEKQFQQYAQKVITYADENGRPTHMLKRAAKEGAGGGLGPIFPGKGLCIVTSYVMTSCGMFGKCRSVFLAGGVRPSYMTADVSGTQLPYYQRGSTDDVKQTIHGKATSGTRLGFGYK